MDHRDSRGIPSLLQDLKQQVIHSLLSKAQVIHSLLNKAQVTHSLLSKAQVIHSPLSNRTSPLPDRVEGTIKDRQTLVHHLE